jgi:hypothetical protein
MEEKKEFTFAERIMLQHAYAPKLVSDCLGIGLGIYFLWQNTLWVALLALFGLSVLGNVIAWKQDIHQLAQTRWEMDACSSQSGQFDRAYDWRSRFSLWRVVPRTHCHPDRRRGILLARLLGASAK